MRKASRSAADHGFALLIVLWTMVLLTLLATRIMAVGRSEAQIGANLRDAAITEAAADGAVHDALFHLLAFGERRWTPAGRRRVAFPSASVDVTVENLAGRVNLNTASAELLGALLDALGVEAHQAASLLAAIVDWRAPGQRRGSYGAKSLQYQAAGRDYGPPGAPFQTVDELGDVLGMTPALLARLRPHLTIWGENDPDPVFADPLVLAALRTLGNDAAVPGSDGSDTLVLAITADANGPAGSHFVRHAVVEIAPSPRGKSWRMLEWAASS